MWGLGGYTEPNLVPHPTADRHMWGLGGAVSQYLPEVATTFIEEYRNNKVIMSTHQGPGVGLDDVTGTAVSRTEGRCV